MIIFVNLLYPLHIVLLSLFPAFSFHCSYPKHWSLIQVMTWCVLLISWLPLSISFSFALWSCSFKKVWQRGCEHCLPYDGVDGDCCFKSNFLDVVVVVVEREGVVWWLRRAIVQKRYFMKSLKYLLLLTKFGMTHHIFLQHIFSHENTHTKQLMFILWIFFQEFQ